MTTAEEQPQRMERWARILHQARELRRVQEQECDVGLGLLMLACLATPKAAGKFAQHYAKTLDCLRRRDRRQVEMRVEHVFREHLRAVCQETMTVQAAVESLKIAIAPIGLQAETDAASRIYKFTLGRWKRESKPQRADRWTVRPRQRRAR